MIPYKDLTLASYTSIKYFLFSNVNIYSLVILSFMGTVLSGYYMVQYGSRKILPEFIRQKTETIATRVLYKSLGFMIVHFDKHFFSFYFWICQWFLVANYFI